MLKSDILDCHTISTVIIGSLGWQAAIVEDPPAVAYLFGAHFSPGPGNILETTTNRNQIQVGRYMQKARGKPWARDVGVGRWTSDVGRRT